MNTAKQYQCSDSLEDGTHTRFWETDRTKSTFSILCLPNGLYDFVDAPESWPNCIEGGHTDSRGAAVGVTSVSDIECIEPPPDVPTHEEYGIITGGAPGIPRLTGRGLFTVNIF